MTLAPVTIESSAASKSKWETVMRHFRALAFVVVVIAAVFAIYQPATSQDRTGERLDELEQRVADLEATVAVLTVSTTPPSNTGEELVYTIQGEFSLSGSSGDEFSIRNGRCTGLGGFDDIYVGAQVRVTDESGALLGLGTLEDDPDSRRCDFVFVVEVPEARFYMVAAGHAGRQGPSYSFEEMEANDWEVALTMG
jgi:hypothetical protein